MRTLLTSCWRGNEPARRFVQARGHRSTGQGEQPPAGCLDHNAGIRAYTTRVQAIGRAYPEMSVDRQVYSTNVRLGRRGVLI